MHVCVRVIVRQYTHTRSHMSLSEWTRDTLSQPWTKHIHSHTHPYTRQRRTITYVPMYRCTVQSGVAVKLKSDPSVSLDSRHETVYFSRFFFLFQFFRGGNRSIVVGHGDTLHVVVCFIFIFVYLWWLCFRLCVWLCVTFMFAQMESEVYKLVTNSSNQQFVPFCRLGGCVSSCCCCYKNQ